MSSAEFHILLERLAEIERRLDLLTGPMAAEQARQLRAATREQVKAHNKLVREQALRRTRSTDLTDRATSVNVAIDPSAVTPPAAGGSFFRGVKR